MLSKIVLALEDDLIGVLSAKLLITLVSPGVGGGGSALELP